MRNILPTPFTIRVPTRVTNPLTLSDREEEIARVVPGSSGASRATHSCSPLFREPRFSCKRSSSHVTSAFCDTCQDAGSKEVGSGADYQSSFFLLDQLFMRYRGPHCRRHNTAVCLLVRTWKGTYCRCAVSRGGSCLCINFNFSTLFFLSIFFFSAEEHQQGEPA